MKESRFIEPQIVAILKQGELVYPDVSMSISGEFEIVFEEGAKTIRVGRAIFRPRRLRDSRYWRE